MKLDELRKSLIVCENNILKKDIINQIINIINDNLNNTNKDTLIKYQQTIYYIQVYHNINLQSTLDKLNNKIGMNFSDIQINNYYHIQELLKKMPYWIDIKYIDNILYNSLSKDCDFINTDINENNINENSKNNENENEINEDIINKNKTNKSY